MTNSFTIDVVWDKLSGNAPCMGINTWDKVENVKKKCILQLF